MLLQPVNTGALAQFLKVFRDSSNCSHNFSGFLKTKKKGALHQYATVNSRKVFVQSAD